jgi:hypothetical protein
MAANGSDGVHGLRRRVVVVTDPFLLWKNPLRVVYHTP